MFDNSTCRRASQIASAENSECGSYRLSKFFITTFYRILTFLGRERIIEKKGLQKFFFDLLFIKKYQNSTIFTLNQKTLDETVHFGA